MCPLSSQLCKSLIIGVRVYDFTFNIQDESCLLNIYTKKLQKRAIAEFEELNGVHLYSHKSLTEADGVPTLSMLKASVVLCRKMQRITLQSLQDPLMQHDLSLFNFPEMVLAT
jgi:hypothetical protein